MSRSCERQRVVGQVSDLPTQSRDIRRAGQRPALLLAAALVALFFSSSTRAATFEWKTETPEQHGFSTAKLDALRDQLVAHKTKIFLLIHDDRIIYEWYG